MASKFLKDETIDLRVTYDYYGNPRTMVTDISTSVLYSFSFSDFEEYIKQVSESKKNIIDCSFIVEKNVI